MKSAIDLLYWLPYGVMISQNLILIGVRWYHKIRKSR